MSPDKAPSPDRVEVKPETPASKTSVEPGELFERVRERIGSRPSLRSLLKGATLEDFDGERALIRVGEHDQLEFARLNSNAIAELFRQETGQRVRIAFEAPTPSGDQDGAPRAITPDVRKEAESNPLVRRAMELFDARVVRVEDRREPKQPPPTEGDG